MQENAIEVNDDESEVHPSLGLKQRARAVAWFVGAAVTMFEAIWFGVAMANAGRWLLAVQCGAGVALVTVAVVRKLLAK